MEKLGRKPSTDPVQEKLRQNKALWNKDVSMFINDLIHLKKTMNGWPSKFFQEKSTIKEPIPADAPTIIGSLAGDFQSLSERANKLVQEQLNYSKNRRKKQPKQLNLPLGTPASKPEPEAPKPDLSQQLSFPAMASSKSDLIKLASSMEEKYDLASEASNPFSRTLFRVTNPTIGWGKKVERRRTRRTMLASTLAAWKGLEKFQVMVVKSSNASIQDSYQKIQDVWTEFQTAVRTYVDFKKSLAAEQGELEEKMKDQDRRQGEMDSPDGAPPEGAESPAPNPKSVANPKSESDVHAGLEKIVNDYLTHRDILRPFDTAGIFNELDSICDTFKATKGRLKFNDKLLKMYMPFVNAAGQLGAALGLPNANSFRELAAKARTMTPPTPATPPAPDLDPTKTASADIEKVAQDFLKKWVGRTRHNLIPGKTSDQRMRCYRMAENLRKKLDKVMDEVQGQFRFEVLDDLMSDASEELNSLKGMTRNLYSVFMRHQKAEKPPKEKK